MTVTSTTDTKKFGYYQVGDLSVFSKIEALELSNRLNLPITWHYNDEIFSSYNWSIEPTPSLIDFYQSRARQIREQYDYIILFYSGGADSHNMLESFLRAGLQIDEIASFHCFSADGDRNSRFNREIFETAIPYVENLKIQGRLSATTQHRTIDMADIITKFCEEVNWLDFPYMVNSTVTINNVARANLRKYITDWSTLIDQGKRVGLIWGHDKPRIMHEENRFFLHFMDIFDNCISTWIQQKQPAGWFDEMFYSTPDMPELIIKQAHVIKNFLLTCPEDHPYLTKEVSGLGHVVKHRSDGSWQSYWLTQDAQSLLIYPWFNINLHYDKKPLDVIYSHRDQWFWSDQVISREYHKVINGLTDRFKDQWLNQDPTRGIRCTHNYRSRRYWL